MFVSWYQSQRFFWHHYYLPILFVIASMSLEIKAHKIQSPDRKVDRVTTLRAGRPRNRGSISRNSKRYSLLLLWSPLSLLFDWYWGLFPRGLKRYERKADFHTEPRLRIHRPTRALSTCLQEMVYQQTHIVTCTLYTIRTDKGCD
jgi:hypothetical protein